MAGTNEVSKNTVILDGKQAEKELKQLVKRGDELINTMHQAKKAGDDISYDKALKEFKKVERKQNAVKKGAFDVNRVLNNIDNASFNDLNKAFRKLNLETKKLERNSEDYNKNIEKMAILSKRIDSTRKEMRGVNKEAGGLLQTLKRLGPAIGVGLVLAGLTNIGRRVIETRKEFEKFEAVLTNTLGSKSEAQQALKDIQEFAARTPFSVAELTGSFVKLANQGFKPTIVEMRRLGDLAASTGKEYDMLAEAIIDAQVGEFERLKEFGIRAQKEGDKVTFTFKGVKKQVDFTEKSIQNYILSLGDVAGVSGSMSAISQTMEGQISNLGDSFDRLFNNLGKKGKNAFAGVVGAINNVVNATSDWLELDPEDELKQQQIQLNLLVDELSRTNEGEDRRLQLINQIKSEYPEFLEGLESEKITNEDLKKQLIEVNQQYLNRIIIARKQEEVDKIQKKFLDQANSAADTELELRKQIQEAGIKLNITEQLLGKTFEEQVTLIEKANKEQRKLVGTYTTIGGQTITIRDQLERYNEQQIKTQERQSLLNDVLSEKENLAKKLGITLEETTEKEKEFAETAKLKPPMILPEFDIKNIDTASLEKFASDLDEKWHETFAKEHERTEEQLSDAALQMLYDFEEKKMAIRRQYQVLSLEELEQIELQQLENNAWALENEEEFQKAKADIQQKYLDIKAQKDREAKEEEKERIIENLATIEAFADMALQLQQSRLDAELSQLENQKQTELALAGDNAEQKAKIEENYQQKEKQIKKRYADEEFAITIAKIIASTAQAVAKFWGTQGPAAIATQFIPIAAGAVQLAIATNQRNKVSQLATGRYDVIGASDGRLYSGVPVQGEVKDSQIVRGKTLISERGDEMVLTAPHVRNLQFNYPALLDAIFATRVPQRAEGNYTAAAATAASGSADTSSSSGFAIPNQNNNIDKMIMLLDARLARIEANTARDTKAYVVMTEFKNDESKYNKITGAAAR